MSFMYLKKYSSFENHIERKKILLYEHDGFLRTDLTSKSYGFRAFSENYSIKLTKSGRQCSREQGPTCLILRLPKVTE